MHKQRKTQTIVDDSTTITKRSETKTKIKAMLKNRLWILLVFFSVLFHFWFFFLYFLFVLCVASTCESTSNGLLITALFTVIFRFVVEILLCSLFRAHGLLLFACKPVQMLWCKRCNGITIALQSPHTCVHGVVSASDVSKILWLDWFFFHFILFAYIAFRLPPFFSSIFLVFWFIRQLWLAEIESD